MQRALLILGLAWALAACAARSSAPVLEPGYRRGGVPDLAGARVMVFPIQLGGEAYPELDSEIEYALGRAGDATTWLFPEELDEAISRNPGTALSIRNLPVRVLLAAEIERLGDTLFAQVYRLGMLTNSGYALIPLETRETQGTVGVFLEVTSVLVDARSGLILWMGVVRGTDGPEGAVTLTATAAEALALEVAP